MPYNFPGLRPFMEQVCESKGRDLHQLGRAVELWHSKQVQNALGQIPGLDPSSRLASLQQVIHHRESLACALEGIDLAIMDVVTEFDLPVPAFLDIHERVC